MRHVVVIGAGFSGALTAVNLLRYAHGQPLRVTLLNKSGRMARGLAYGTASSDHVLNVPAGNMSALADEPDDFLRYCRWANPDLQPSSFVSRRLYGSYLEALLDAAEHGARSGVLLDRVSGEVVAVVPHDDHAEVVLADGKKLQADRVVLAFGHFAPRTPQSLAALATSPHLYVRDPWKAGCLDRIAPEVPVLLMGAGLTALDVATALHRGTRRPAPIWMLSRRGLLPQPHREARGVFPPQATAALIEDMQSNTRSGLRAVRQAMQRHMATGGDWRDVMGALRPHAPAVWHRLDARERRRFLRHLQPFWDAARHRCAPATFEQLLRWQGDGSVERIAGRLASWRATGEDLEVAIAPRNGSAPLTLRVGVIVNCTGPEADLSRVDDLLVRQLLHGGFARPDAAGVGIDADYRGALLNADGTASEHLFYIGPLLRGRDWEATAVPELRQHAYRLALDLLREFEASPEIPTH